MNKKHIVLIASSLVFFSSLFSPVSAQSGIDPPGKKIHRFHLIRLSQGVAGCCTGFVVGMPVCFVKKLAAESDYGTHEIIGGFTDDDGRKSGKKLYLPVYIIWLPAASLTSFIEAPVFSFRNAVRADKPFSKEQFSLSECDLSE